MVKKVFVNVISQFNCLYIRSRIGIVQVDALFQFKLAVGDLIYQLFCAPAAGMDDSSLERKQGDTKEHPLGQWFLKHSEVDELAVLTATRQQVKSIPF
jgi:hypothetical protein